MELERTKNALEVAARRYQRAVSRGEGRQANAIADAVIAALEPLLTALANKRALRGMETEEIVQAGRVAVLRALRTYDPANPNKASFATFVYSVVDNDIRHYVRDNKPGVISEPAYLGYNRRRVTRAQNAAQINGEGDLSIAELAARTGISERDVVAVFESEPTLAAPPARLGLGAANDEADRTPGTIRPDSIADPVDAIAALTLRLDIKALLDCLPAVYCAVLTERFLEGKSIAEIAASRGMSGQGVRAQIERGLTRLRDVAGALDYTP